VTLLPYCLKFPSENFIPQKSEDEICVTNLHRFQERMIYRQMADNYSAQYFMFNEGIAVAIQIFVRLFLSAGNHEDEHASARKCWE
jgi:hypothetical protein